MSIIQSIILGIVEGVTEFLPISSTAHLLITQKILGLANSEFTKSFAISIQLGAILSVVVLYWRRLFTSWENIRKIAVAFVPTALIGFVLYKLIKGFLMESMVVIAVALIIGGIIMIIFERSRHYEKNDENTVDLSQVSYRRSFIIGLVQSLAVVPGVSRSAATIIGGLALGIGRATIVEFSFLLAVPTMVAATGYDIMKSGFDVGTELGVWLIGFAVSFIVAMFAIRFLVSYIQRHNFISFGIYRIVVGLLILGFIFLG